MTEARQQEIQEHLAMLRIIFGVCSTALDVFRGAEEPVDPELVGDLEKMVALARIEISRLEVLAAEGS